MTFVTLLLVAAVAWTVMSAFSPYDETPEEMAERVVRETIRETRGW